MNNKRLAQQLEFILGIDKIYKLSTLSKKN